MKLPDSLYSQVQLDPITNTVILQRKLILKRPLPLPLQHNFVRLPSNPRSHLSFEQFLNMSAISPCWEPTAKDDEKTY